MFNVTVVFTQHQSDGMCNSDELLKILWSLHPDVIFEEIKDAVYDQVYAQQSRSKLESTAIQLYLLTKVAEHIPVDTFPCSDAYYRNTNHLLDIIGKNLSKSEGLTHAFNQLAYHVPKGGFPFLNSDPYDTLMDNLENEEKRILAELADDRLLQIAQQRIEVNSKRDEEMIDNIYKYGEKHPFQTGALLIGAGHRRSFKSKLDKIVPRYGVEIKWHFLK